ncbi:MAG TPA: ATP-binding cassette domain-containing protein [Afifellaceae bacterium]|nr:ATP-binding cassette domain-containing protein [Afifellaceae bacterium]
MSNQGSMAGGNRTGLIFNRVEISLHGDRLVAVDAHIPPGEVFTVMGPSGSGKSTLLAYVAGFLDPVFSAAGRILLNGEDVTDLQPERRGMGLLFQDPLLFPHLSVGGNLLFGLAPAIKGHTARREAVEAALHHVGMDGFIDRDPATLSGGQRARVALMRTLLSKPAALLLDEPFSKLDTARRGQVRDLVFAEARERGLPVLLVTHDIADAEAAGGPCIVLA